MINREAFGNLLKSMDCAFGVWIKVTRRDNEVAASFENLF